MTSLDWIVVATTAFFALSGYSRGFIVGALSLIGFGIGAVAGTRLAASLLSGGNSSPYSPAFALLGAIFAGAILSAGLEGFGLRILRAVRLPFVGLADGVLGAVLSAGV